MHPDTEYIFVHAVLVGPSAILLVAAFAKQIQQANPNIQFLRAFAIAGFSLLVAIVVAVLVGVLIMFAPSYFAEDFIGLPWYTMIPAWSIGIYLGIWIYNRMAHAIAARPSS
jgi:hypothetical protein